MAYCDFSFETVEAELGVVAKHGHVITDLKSVTVPGWLTDQLERGSQFPLITEKARSELIVAPILMAVRELSNRRLTIFSGARFDVDPARRLNGECDFILTLSDAVLTIKAPLLSVVEAKRQDIELGIGQCIAQMVASQCFNERAGKPMPNIFGCVTTGDNWQFLKLTGTDVTVEPKLFFLDNLGGILAAFLAMIPPA